MSETVTDYCIATGDSANQIHSIVRKMIEEGWEPQGGLACSSYPHSGPQLHQAMVKKVTKVEHII